MMTPSTASTLLTDILKKESSNLRQWRAHLCALTCVLIAFATSLLRGSPKSESVIGIERCGVLDWTILIAFLITMSMIIMERVSVVRKE